MNQFQFLKILLSILVLQIIHINGLHLQGTWKSSDFYVFLAKFGFQKTDMHDRVNTQGYIYGNITSKDNVTTDLSLVVVDSEYFLEFFGNSSVMPRTKACPRMLKKVDTIAWDADCNRGGQEDFIRRIPCPVGRLCADEDTPSHVVRGHQFTYSVQDTSQPRFWYISFVSCYRNTTNHACDWTHNSQQSIEIDYDIWLVNGNPYTKHFNPFEHQFSFELHDVVEIYLTFFLIYTILLPIQIYAFLKQKHVMTRLLTGCMICEYIGVIANFIHFIKFAFDGKGVEPLRIGGISVDMISQCLLMLLLLLIAKGWTITTLELSYKKLFLALWAIYTAIYMALFIWNLTEVDIISDTDEWQTWPGLIILLIRILAGLWFLFELRNSFNSETNEEKTKFFLHFGAGFLVWFIYLPIVALIGTQVSALWRFKTILSVMYAADFLAFCVLVHILWPTRPDTHFDLRTKVVKFKKRTPNGNSSTRIEIKGLLDESTDSCDSGNSESPAKKSNGHTILGKHSKNGRIVSLNGSARKGANRNGLRRIDSSSDDDEVETLFRKSP